MAKKVAIIILYTLIIVVTLAILLLVTVPRLYWDKQPAKPLEVWILDKTVPVPDYREHKGLMWILNYNKVISASNQQPFQYNRDYFGYFPAGKDMYGTRELPSGQHKIDLIYLVDTYGVYNDDYVFPKLQNKSKDLIYGGLTTGELNIIKANLGNGNTIIGEFNIASAPTNLENRRELERIFGLRWLGWKGRYYKELSRSLEVPEQIVKNYEKYSQKAWNFSGEGYVLVSDDDEVAVLERNRDLGEKGLEFIINQDFNKEFGVNKRTDYCNWFEFVRAQPGTQTIAEFKLDLNEQGKKVLEKIGLDARFPAVVRSRNTQFTSYYFSGDFADVQHDSKIWKYYGIERIKKFTSSFNKKSPEYFYWHAYVPLMNKIISEIENGIVRTQVKQAEHPVEFNVKTDRDGFLITDDGQWKKTFIKGVNIGAALPGKWFTEFPDNEEIYLKWFEKIGGMNCNCIRVYTLLPPEFYKALDYYNHNHPHSRLWLLQEIWPEENPPDLNYLRIEYVEEYYMEIEYVLDAIHGQANIPFRKGRAYGIYNCDVSKYVLGYLVGRELEPDEVITTNLLNKGFKYQGDYLHSAPDASPSESWLAMNCDYVLSYEEHKYANQHPVAIVSWPTLDVQEHDSEWNTQGLKSLEFNDKVAIDINHIDTGPKLKSGFFGAYHIYPNYPDFMNNESGYNNYHDQEGRLRYGGYLQEFMARHQKYPALVAEFGLATGMGNAHSSPDGLNHGGLTEEQQGNGIVRMMKAIRKEGYAGGIIFEWLDEWAKKTWITEPYMLPYERHVFWHNVLDPEQNYGLLAMESTYNKDPREVGSSQGAIRKIFMDHDSTFLYIDVVLAQQLDFSKEKLFIGLDTYARDRGELKFDPALNIQSPMGLEFLLQFSGPNNGRILVHPGYNIANNRYSSYSSARGIFEEIRPLINKERIGKDGHKTAIIYQDGSKLNYGSFIDNSHNHWYIQANTVHIRIPWNRINVVDPSSLMVLDDRNPKDLARDTLKTVKTEGVQAAVLLYDVQKPEKAGLLSSSRPYKWPEWTVPQYKERLKKSYFIIKDYFAKL